MEKGTKDIIIHQFKADILKRFESYNTEVIFNKIMQTNRQFKADFFIPSCNCIIEINGGQWTKGRHTRAGKVKGKKCTQYENDLTKMNLAIKNGFYYLQYTYEMIKRGEYIADLDKMVDYVSPI